MLEENERKLVYAAIGVIILLLVVVLLIIWIPTFSKKSNINGIDSIATYEKGTYVEKKKEGYKSLIIRSLNKDNFDETYEILNKHYLEKMNLEKDSLREKLINDNILTVPMTSAVIYCSNIMNNGITYVYTYIYKSANIETKIHVIEENYDTYSISFDQKSYPVLNTEIYEVKDNLTGLDFEIQTKGMYEGNIVYDITIINNTTEEFIISTKEPEDSDLIYYSGGVNNSANLNSIVIGSELSEIISKPNSSNKVTLSYGIALNLQDKINYIRFNDVTRNDGSVVSIQMELK